MNKKKAKKKAKRRARSSQSNFRKGVKVKNEDSRCTVNNFLIIKYF